MEDKEVIKLISSSSDDGSHKYTISIISEFTWETCVELANELYNNDLYSVKLLRSSNGEGEDDYDHLGEIKYTDSLLECESFYNPKKALCIGAMSLELDCRIQIIWYIDSKEIIVYSNKDIKTEILDYLGSPLKTILYPGISLPAPKKAPVIYAPGSIPDSIPKSPRSHLGSDPMKSEPAPKKTTPQKTVPAKPATATKATPAQATPRTTPSVTTRPTIRTGVLNPKLADNPEVELFEKRVKSMTSIIFVAFMIVFVLALVSSAVIAAFFNAQGDFNFGLITVSGIMFLFAMIITGITLKIVEATPSRVHLTKIFKSIGTETAWITIVAVYSVFLYNLINKNTHGNHAGIIYHIVNIAFLIAILFPFLKTIFLIRKEHNEKYPHDKIKRIRFQDFLDLFFNGINENPSEYLVTYNNKDYLASKSGNDYIVYSLDPIESYSTEATIGYITTVKQSDISEVNTFKVFAVFNNHRYEVDILDSFTLTKLLLKTDLNHPVFKNLGFQRYKDYCTFITTIEKISKIYIYKKTVSKDSHKHGTNI